MASEDQKPAAGSSFQVPALSPDQESLFRDVLETLERRQVPFAVSGAFALHEYTGIWRETKDLDLFLPAQGVTRALKVLSEHGFETEVLDRVWLAKVRHGDNFVDLIAGMSNAVVCVTPSWIQRARRSEILGVPVLILSPEELIASKLFVTRRERFDGADICHVIYRTQGALDWRHLLDLLGESWEMLLWHLILYHYVYPSDVDRVPNVIWEELLERLKVELKRPHGASDFRGSLVDDKIFAVDVEEWGKRDMFKEQRRAAKLIGTDSTEAA